jgi:hypothetical protein
VSTSALNPRRECRDPSRHPVVTAGATLHIVARVACPLTGRVDDAPPRRLRAARGPTTLPGRKASLARRWAATCAVSCRPTDTKAARLRSFILLPSTKGRPITALRLGERRRGDSVCDPPYQGGRGHLTLEMAMRAGAKRLCAPCHRCECKHGLYARSVSHVDLPLSLGVNGQVGSPAHLQN